MNILIMSRTEVEELSKKPFSSRVALISITDAGWTFAVLANKPKYILQLAFDDVDNDIFEDELGRAPTAEEQVSIEKKYNMFTDAQAQEIAVFYKTNKYDIDILLCQCEHGQSRSAAVAAAVLEYESKSGISIFSEDKYFPNKVVFRKVLKALSE